jgi:hypothetical protein
VVPRRERIGRMKKLVLLLAFSIAMLGPSKAYADVSVSLTLDRQEAMPSDSIRMVVSVSGARRCDAPPVIEGLDRFRVTQGGSSSRVEIINGNIRSGVDYTYYLTPSQPGTFQVGPARVQVDGEIFQSNTAPLTIVKDTSSASPARGAIFLTAALSSEKAYVEEQVLYTLRLYLRTRVSNISLQLPEQDHLTFQQLDKPREYKGVLDGHSCQIVEVTYAVMGLKDGDYFIQPAQMDMTAYGSGQQSRRGFFDDPFFSDPFFRTGRPVSVSSEPIELKVIPLPAEGKPEGFGGLVGSFTIASELAPAKIRAGESATLTIQVSGRGNVNRIPDLKMPSLDSMKIYADQPVFTAAHDLKGLAGSKIMKWAIVPELPGDYQIPPLSVSFFDPKAGEYRIIQSPGHSLAVIPGKGKMIMVEAGGDRQNGAHRPEKQEIREVGHDILPLHTSVRDMGTRSWARNRGLFLWAVLLLPVFVYVSTFVGLRLKKRSIQTLPAQRAKRAARRLIRQCRQVGDDDAKRLSVAVREYVNNRFGLNLASLTPEDAIGILTSKGVSPETAGKLRDALQDMEDAIYAGKGRGPVRAGDKIPAVVREIEREIR